MNTTDSFVRYRPDVETVDDDEQAQLAEIVAAMRAITERTNERYRHAVRSVHSKSHGILTGTFEVLDDLDPAYAQGLFAHPGRYDVIARFSTNPGDLLPDDVSTPRGLAIKILGPQGQAMLDGHDGEITTDFLFINGPILGAQKPKEFAQQMKLMEKHLEDPVQLKEAISATARGAEQLAKAFGGASPQAEFFGGSPPTNPLGETFNTQLAHRHGDYIAKYALTPASESLLAVKDKRLDLHNPDILRDTIRDFFSTETAVWNFGVQLCTDLETMPIEDGKTEWPQDQSPFVTVARLTFGPQPTYTPERRTYGDDCLSFTPWHGMEAHRPLGAHNRVRKAAYAMSSTFRSTENARPKREPKTAADFFNLST